MKILLKKGSETQNTLENLDLHILRTRKENPNEFHEGLSGDSSLQTEEQAHRTIEGEPSSNTTGSDNTSLSQSI